MKPNGMLKHKTLHKNGGVATIMLKYKTLHKNGGVATIIQG
jgi:hypothetical protein